MVEVKNINGTSKERFSKPKGFSSWLDYWKSESIFSIPMFCACDKCINDVNVGAHVRKTNEDNKWYIVPLCYKCNKKTEPFKVDENLLVEVNKEDTIDIW